MNSIRQVLSHLSYIYIQIGCCWRCGADSNPHFQYSILCCRIFQLACGVAAIVKKKKIIYNTRAPRTCFRGARRIPANRLHGQRTGTFSWRPVPRPFQEDRPIPARPYPEQRSWMVERSDVISVSPRTREMLRHLPTCGSPPWLCPACLPTTTSIPAPSNPPQP